MSTLDISAQRDVDYYTIVVQPALKIIRSRLLLHRPPNVGEYISRNHSEIHSEIEAAAVALPALKPASCDGGATCSRGSEPSLPYGGASPPNAFVPASAPATSSVSRMRALGPRKQMKPVYIEDLAEVLSRQYGMDIQEEELHRLGIFSFQSKAAIIKSKDAIIKTQKGLLRSCCKLMQERNAKRVEEMFSLKSAHQCAKPDSQSPSPLTQPFSCASLHQCAKPGSQSTPPLNQPFSPALSHICDCP